MGVGIPYRVTRKGVDPQGACLANLLTVVSHREVCVTSFVIGCEYNVGGDRRKRNKNSFMS